MQSLRSLHGLACRANARVAMRPAQAQVWPVWLPDSILPAKVVLLRQALALMLCRTAMGAKRTALLHIRVFKICKCRVAAAQGGSCVVALGRGLCLR